MTDWRRASKYHQTNGRYNVAAVKVPRDGALVWRYEAWKLKSKVRSIKSDTLLGIFESGEDARRACEVDAHA